MSILGITSLNHDASAAVVGADGEIIFAGHAERYSRIKNDGMLNAGLIDDALAEIGRPSKIVWYERPWLKKTRQAYAGQWSELFAVPSPREHLREFGLGDIPIHFVGHHRSHAAAGYFTSGFDDAAVLVCDAIGEWDTISLWEGRGGSLRKLWSQRYPNSLGLLYSAFTQRLGLKPNEEEYIMMGMAALGEPRYAGRIMDDFVRRDQHGHFVLKRNVHRGIRGWAEGIDAADADEPEQERYNIAASIQLVAELWLVNLVCWISEVVDSPNLVMMGGVALNCVANSKIAELELYDRIHIMPNPGDAGSALGAIAAYLNRPLDWRTPYLGHDISREFNHRAALELLLAGNVIGIANGRAEFGPRALGNRSLICDPRGPDMKDRVNAIKKREPFRPFAPIILAERAHDFFEMPVATSPYMQFTARVKRPDLFPAITHYDGTARVQTLTRDQNPNFYKLLAQWEMKTGCPMLLNTSLNVKGEPLVNTWEDAQRFARLYGVPVL